MLCIAQRDAIQLLYQRHAARHLARAYDHHYNLHKSQHIDVLTLAVDDVIIHTHTRRRGLEVRLRRDPY